MGLLVGCTSVPVATPTAVTTPAARAAMTPQVLGTLIEEHFGPAYAVAGGDAMVEAEPDSILSGIGATGYYRATPGVPNREVNIAFSAMPYRQVRCSDCVEREGALISTGDSGLKVLLPREGGLVQVRVEGVTPAEAMVGAAVALARDSRVGPLADDSLIDASAANPRWREHLGCANAVGDDLVPLPERSGPAQPPTPQALAAVIASHVTTGCVGGRSAAGAVEAVAYLDSDSERVSLAVTDAPQTCRGWDRCETRGDVKIRWQFDVAEGNPATVSLSRPATDGSATVVVEHSSESAAGSEHTFPVPLTTLLELVKDERVGSEVDAALNQAGNSLPLLWRLEPQTVE